MKAEIKEITRKELFEYFDKEVYPALNSLIEHDNTEAIVIFENQNFDSSAFGARTAIKTGENCTYKSFKDCEGKWLYDLPSQRQYPIAVYIKPSLFRELDLTEIEEFRKWADDNYKAFSDISPLWHPEVRQRCGEINATAQRLTKEGLANQHNN